MQFFIARQPEGAPVTERAIPVAIFHAEDSVRKHFLRRWLKTNAASTPDDIRDIIDWQYYTERLGSTIMKIITIPAAMQNVANPVPRVKHPDWLQSRLLAKSDKYKQKNITDMFARLDPVEQLSLQQESEATRANIGDIEDQFSGVGAVSPQRAARTVLRKGRGGSKKPWEKKRKDFNADLDGETPTGDWREVLGEPPSISEAPVAWAKFHKAKWRMQRANRKQERLLGVSKVSSPPNTFHSSARAINSPFPLFFPPRRHDLGT